MRNFKRLLAGLLLAPLALAAQAAQFSKSAPKAPVILPTVNSVVVPALPSALPALNVPAADVAAALAPIPTIPVANAFPDGSRDGSLPLAVAQLQRHFSGVSSIQSSLSGDATGEKASRRLDSFFAGSRQRRDSGAVSSGGARHAGAVNDEGMLVTGRTAQQYHEIKRLEAELKALGVNLNESMNVMDDAYAEVWSKLTALRYVIGQAKAEDVSGANTHLDKTLTWVDGMIESGGRRIAVQTNRVFFHPAPNRESEIAEGIRRAGKTLDQMKIQFSPGGAAEQALQNMDEKHMSAPIQAGAKPFLDEVVLGFDTRGYDEIKQYIKSRQAEFGPRYRFVFTDEIARTPKNVQDMRAQVRALAAEYSEKQLENIYDGVTYSRYVGLLLELKTIEYYAKRGYQILESGRDFFDPSGQYKTEFDAVVKSPKGEIMIIEAKSARVPLTLVKDERDKAEMEAAGTLDVMEEKFLYKLRMYQRDRQIIEDYVRKHYGPGPISIGFSTDLGGRDKRAAMEGVLVWKDPAQAELKEYLEDNAPRLSSEYGYPVSFLFLNSRPGENPMLYYQRPVSKEDWEAAKSQGGQQGRRHGRGRR